MKSNYIVLSHYIESEDGTEYTVGVSCHIGSTGIGHVEFAGLSHYHRGEDIVDDYEIISVEAHDRKLDFDGLETGIRELIETGIADWIKSHGAGEALSLWKEQRS